MQSGGLRPEPGVAAARPPASPHRPCYQGSAEAAARCKRGRIVLGSSHYLSHGICACFVVMLLVWVCRNSIYKQDLLLMLLLPLAQTMCCRILHRAVVMHLEKLAFIYITRHLAQTKLGKAKTILRRFAFPHIGSLQIQVTQEHFQASAAMLLCRWPCTVTCTDTQGSMAHSCMAVSKHQAHK